MSPSIPRDFTSGQISSQWNPVFTNEEKKVIRSAAWLIHEYPEMANMRTLQDFLIDVGVDTPVTPAMMERAIEQSVNA